MHGWKLRELVMGAHFQHAHIHLVLNLIKAFLAPVILPIGPAAALYDGVNAHSVYMVVWLRSAIKICDRSAYEVILVCGQLRVLRICAVRDST